MLRGLTTLSFWARDLAEAKSWYVQLLGIDPYFERPGYVEFRLGDYQHELGVIDSSYAPAGAATSPGGAVVYWHVDDVSATLARLLSMGASGYQPLTDRGHRFVTASVVDPFGNVLGIMSNPHYLEVLATMKDDTEPRQFASPDAFREWLKEHQDSSPGVWLALAKKGARAPSLTYAQALDAALEHGWIDGLARRLDDQTYLQRFTPRRPRSPWSARNRRRAEAMIAEGRMAPRGLAEVERARADGRWN